MTSVGERGASAAAAAAPQTRAPQGFTLPGRGDSLLIVVAITAVSTSGPIIAACGVASLAVAFWRNAMASVILLPVALSRAKDRAGLRSAVRRDGRAALLAGLLLALHFGTWIPSISLTSVASATALVATQPVWSALLAKAAGAHIPRGAWVGIAVATAGAGLVTGVDVTLSGRAVTGDLLAVVGGAFAAAYVQAGGIARRSLSTTAYTSTCYSVCALLLLAVCLIGRLPLSGYSGRNWLLLLALTAGPQLLGHSVINRVLRSTSPAVMSLCILFEVPGAALLAYLWLNQTPSVLVLPGIAMLVLGVALVVRAAGKDPDGATAAVVTASGLKADQFG